MLTCQDSLQAWLLLHIPVAQLGVQSRGKSSGSTEVMALVKPLPNPPWLSQQHLPLQCACSSSPAMCHCELISSYHTRVQGR